MKLKTQLTLLLVLVVFKLFSQTTNHYQELYDDTSFCSTCMDDDYLKNIKIEGCYWGGSELLESLLLMYEETKDIKYLDVFKSNVQYLLDRRDDRRGLGLDRKVWSTSKYNENSNNEVPNLVGNTNIIYNFVKFYNIVYNDVSALSIYRDFADILLNRAKETFYFYNTYYVLYSKNNIDCGAYIELYDNELLGEVNSKFEKARLPLNIQASMGRVLIELYKASINGSCEKDEFKNKLIELANHFKVHTNTVTNSENNRGRKQWTYWGYQDPEWYAYNNGKDPETINSDRLNNPLRDDVSHSALTIMFPYECYENHIKDFEGNLLFNQQDMEEYANTLLDDVLDGSFQNGNTTQKGSLIINWGVYNGYENPRKNLIYKNPPVFDPEYYQIKKYTQFTYERWITFSKYSNKRLIFNALNDLNTSKYYFIGTNTPQQNFSPYLQRPLTLSYLNKYQQRFAPIAAEHGWSKVVKQIGVVAGNFNTEEGDEFVYIRDYGASKGGTGLRLEKVKPNDYTFYSTSSWSSIYDYEHQWANIGAGNFIEEVQGTEQVDEIIAISNSSTDSKSGYFLFSINGNKIEKKSELVNYTNNQGNSFGWIGATGGNFDVNKSKDQIVSARNNGLKLEFLEVDSNNQIQKLKLWSIESISGLDRLGLNTNNSNIAAIASGDLITEKSGDEIVLLINSNKIDLDSPNGGSLSGAYIFQIDENYALKFLYKSTGWGAGSDFKGLSVGDYNGDGKDDFLMHRNSDGFYRMYSINYTAPDNYSLVSLGAEFFPKNQSNDGVIAAGNFDVNSKNDEIIVLRKDGGIVAYTFTEKVANTPTPTTTYLFENEKAIKNEIENVTIYPNPTTGLVNIEAAKKIKSVRLTDVNGKKVKSNYNKDHRTINVSNLSSGIYFLKIKLQDNSSETKKIIKN